jgi:hypothetical protein
MAIVIGHMGPRVLERHPRQERRRKPPPEPGPASAPTETARDGPAGTYSPRVEQQRAEIAALDQALQQAETAAALARKASEGLAEAQETLDRLQRAVAAALSDAAGPALEAREREIGALLERLRALAAGWLFGERKLLDGSLATFGEARGAGLRFVAASPRTRASPPEGYPVAVWTAPRRARLAGGIPLSAELLKRPIRLGVRLGDQWAEARTQGGESDAEVLAALSWAIRKRGLELQVAESAERVLIVEHVRYGPGRRFWADSLPVGILSLPDGTPRAAEDGCDVAGSIGGEPADGRGEFLIGRAGNRATEGLIVDCSGVPPRSGDSEPAVEAGRVIVIPRGLGLRSGSADPQDLRLQVPSADPEALGRGVFNHSGFASLAEIRVDAVRQARDASKIVERARREIGSARLAVGQALNETLHPRLVELRARTGIGGPAEEGGAAWARTLAAWVSERMEVDRPLARQAQLHPPPGAVMKLIN